MLLTCSNTSDGVLLCKGGRGKGRQHTGGPGRFSTSSRLVVRHTHLRVADDVVQHDNVLASGEVLQDLDLALDLLLLDGFQDLDDAFLFADEVDAFKHFRVLFSRFPGFEGSGVVQGFNGDGFGKGSREGRVDAVPEWEFRSQLREQ